MYSNLICSQGIVQWNMKKKIFLFLFWQYNMSNCGKNKIWYEVTVMMMMMRCIYTHEYDTKRIECVCEEDNNNKQASKARNHFLKHQILLLSLTTFNVYFFMPHYANFHSYVPISSLVIVCISLFIFFCAIRTQCRKYTQKKIKVVSLPQSYSVNYFLLQNT